MIKFPKDCWDKNCEHLRVTVKAMSIDDSFYTCEMVSYECDASDEDYWHLRCPLAEEDE